MAKKASKLGLIPVHSTKDPEGNRATGGEELAAAVRHNNEIIEEAVLKAQDTAEKAQETASSADTALKELEKKADKGDTEKTLKEVEDEALLAANLAAKASITGNHSAVLLEAFDISILPKDNLLSPKNIVHYSSLNTDDGSFFYNKNSFTFHLVPVKENTFYTPLIPGNSVHYFTFITYYDEKGKFISGEGRPIHIKTPEKTAFISLSTKYQEGLSFSDYALVESGANWDKYNPAFIIRSKETTLTFEKEDNSVATILDIKNMETILNISQQRDKYDYENSSSAHADVPQDQRKQGKVIAFKLDSGLWKAEQFTGDNILEWNNSDYWQDFGSSDRVLDGGRADSVYGGARHIDGGTAKG